MREATVSAGFVRALMELAVRKGASQMVLSEQSGIDPADLEDQDNRIALAKYIALMRAGQALGNDPALALHFGEAYDMSELSIVALIGQTCQTMSEAMEQLDRFGRLIIDVEVEDPAGRRLVLSRENGQVWLIDTRKNPNACPEITESGFARIASASRRFPGQLPAIQEIHVTHSAPSYSAEYDRVFQAPVYFASGRNALLMNDDLFMTHRTPNPSRYVFGILSERAEALLKALENSETTQGRVESLLMPILHTGGANMDIVATKMGLSRTTLFRKLKAEGATFEKVLDDLRYQMALVYLAERKVSVNETAYLVGFSSAAAFSRAFKRWTGTSPRMLRASRIENRGTEPS
ncbi:MAG TPA: AraC family transcriptional regulator [Rhizomicrobium sp.]